MIKREKYIKGFKTFAEIKQYLSAERLVCLECGKTYKMLGNHLLAKHGISADLYRDKYGIPHSFALYGSGTLQTLKEKGKERVENEEYKQKLIKKLREYKPYKGMNKRTLRASELERLKVLNLITKVPKEAVEEYINRMIIAKLSPREFLTSLKEENGYLNSKSSTNFFYKLVRRYELEENLKGVWEVLTFRQCADARVISKKLMHTVQKLKGKGFSQNAIARDLGLAPMSITRIVRKYNLGE